MFNLFSKKISTGAILNTPEEIEKFWTHDEMIGAGGVQTVTPFSWEERQPDSFTIRNQGNSGMCGAFSLACALGVNNYTEKGEYVNLSPAFIFQRRFNRPQTGMAITDIFKIANQFGSPVDNLLLDDKQTDKWADSQTYTQGQKDEALTYKASLNYVFLQKNIDQIAQVIAAGQTPIMLIEAGLQEWTEYPQVIKNTGELRHFIPMVDFVLRNGKKYIVVNDSWGWSGGKNGYRYISEEFIQARAITIGYSFDFVNPALPVIHRPKYSFTVPLTYGMKNSGDVKALQEILKYEGCLADEVPVTGNYLDMTALAVKKLQLKNQIASVSEIESLKGKRVGTKTLEYLKKYA